MSKWIGPAVVVLIAVLAEATVGRAAGGPDAAFFLGRFHPLVVHLPIGFFLLVAAGEVATFHPRLRDRVEPALGLLVPLSAAAALAAFLMGQLLALEGGFPAQALTWHRRLTLLAVIGMAGCWIAYERAQRSGQGRWLYRGVMGGTLGLLSLGAHFGGTMTRGEAYLSKYAPGPLKPLLGSSEPAAPEASANQPLPAGPEPLVFAHAVLPILNEHCVECHGAEKQKGKLRVDSLEELMKGGENGAAVVPGAAAKSALLQRMLLPVTDDDRMPPEGKPSPKPEELALIEFWLERGASATLRVKDALAPSTSRTLLERAAGAAAPPARLPGAAASPAADAAATSPAPSPADSSSTKREAAGTDVGAAAREGAGTDVGAGAGVGAAKTDSTGGANPHAAPPKDHPVASSTTGDSASEQAPAANAAAPPVAKASVSGAAFLSTYCVKCHGPQKAKGKLRVDSLAALLKGGAEGPALVPGSPDKSTIVTRVRLPLSSDEHMPPAKEPQPTAAEVAAFAAWVRAGGGSGAGSAGASLATSPARTSSSPRADGIAARAPADSASGAVLSSADGRGSSPAATQASATAATANADALPVTGDDVAAAAASTTSTTPPSTAAEAAARGAADPALVKSLPRRVLLFADAVQPVLAEKCGKCHIKDKPAGGLDVSKHAAILEGGYSGPGVIAKDRAGSPLFARIVLPPSDDERMPPEGEPALSADEIELIGAWIDHGAPAASATDVAGLPAGAARTLAARGVKAAPEPLAAQAGGCAACTVPGAPTSRWLAAQSLALIAVALLLAVRRSRRST